MIGLEVSGLHLEPGSVELDAQLEARCVGRLAIFDSRGSVFAENEFPCLELARAFRAWSSSHAPPQTDFEFDSMGYREPGLVWIRRDTADDERWRIGSIVDASAVGEPTQWPEVLQAVEDFARQVAALAPESNPREDHSASDSVLGHVTRVLRLGTDRDSWRAPWRVVLAVVGMAVGLFIGLLTPSSIAASTPAIEALENERVVPNTRAVIVS